MSVKRLFSPETLCHCVASTENESLGEAIVVGNISPIRKPFLKPQQKLSSDAKKKISIKKHMEGSLKKKKSQQIASKVSGNTTIDYHIGKSNAQVSTVQSQNHPNYLNQVIYQIKPQIIKQEPKVIPRQIIHISHHYHFNQVEQQQPQTIQRNTSPSIIFSKLTINTNEPESELAASKESLEQKGESKLSTNVPSRCKTTTVSFHPTTKQSSYQLPKQNKHQTDNLLTEFRNVESVYGGSISSSIGSNISIVDKSYFDRNYIYEVEDYKASKNRISNCTTAIKARDSTTKRSEYYGD